MKIKSTNERGDFLNDTQKKIKADIMVKIIDGLFDTLKDNQEHFKDAQHILDLIFSILVMFNREVLVHLISTFEMNAQKNKMMNDLFSTISDQVNLKCGTH